MLGTRLHFGGGVALAILMASCGASTTEPVSPEPSAEPDPGMEAEAEESSEGTEEAAQAEEAEESSEGTYPGAVAEIEPGSPLEELMRNHFKDADLIRRAIIAGKPENAVEPARSLAHLGEKDELPAKWEVPVQRMRDSASRVENASDVAQAAAGTADIGRACGMCHQNFGGPKPQLGEAPEAGDSVASRMRQHAWATERLWEGLYVPSGPAWKAGAKVLEGATFPEELLKKGGVYARSAAKDFAKIAAKAPSQSSLTSRGSLYAELLGTCAACHLAMK